MPSPKPAPDLAIPASETIVTVSILDTLCRMRLPPEVFVQDKIPGHDVFEVPAFQFLIEHPSGKKVVFDLGLRKDGENLAPAILAGSRDLDVKVETDVASLLKEDGRIGLDEINALIISHWHADHIGDPTTFPSSSKLVVGPGFQSALMPGYPANPEGLILESDYKGRELEELDFASHPAAGKVGNFRSIDYFGDGSFYLLDVPGHTFGHICALARTTPSTFILMGADTCHHCGSMRPTEYLPIPDEISPSPFSVPPFASGSVCMGSALEHAHPQKTRTAPFYKHFSEAPDRNLPQVEKSRDILTEFDANDDVFVVIAHDGGLLNVVDFFPKTANEWKAKGWKEEGRWKFLADFKEAAAQ